MFGKVVHALGNIRGELHAVTVGLSLLVKALREGSEGTSEAERVTSLEGAIERLEGRIDAGLVKIESVKGAARAAEDRARGFMRRAEEFAETPASDEAGPDEDQFEAAARQLEEYVPDRDVEGGGFVPDLPGAVVELGADRAAIRAMKRR